MSEMTGSPHQEVQADSTQAAQAFSDSSELYKSEEQVGWLNRESASSNLNILYRTPRFDDLERLAEIYNHAVRETAATFDTEEKAPCYFQSFIPGDHLYRMLVAEVDGQAVAFAGTYPFSQRKAYSQLAEMMIYVHPSWQRRRIGRNLLSEIHKNGFLRGLHTVLVLINKENTYMHRVFEEMGYIYKGEMTDVAIKFGRRHSLVIYQRDVII